MEAAFKSQFFRVYSKKSQNPVSSFYIIPLNIMSISSIKLIKTTNLALNIKHTQCMQKKCQLISRDAIQVYCVITA